MRFARRPLRWLCGWLAVMLFSMQLATAAYACPGNVPVQPAPTMAEMPGCDGHERGAMDPEQRPLCQAHCQQGSQAVAPQSAGDVPAATQLLAVLDWRPTASLPAPWVARQPQRASGASPPGSPPLFLSLLVLRN